MKDLRTVDSRIILAEGEVTGHCHEVVTEAGLPPDMATAQYFEEPDGTRVLIALAPCILKHDEHGEILLDPACPKQVAQGDLLLTPRGEGCWVVDRQRELMAGVWIRVSD